MKNIKEAKKTKIKTIKEAVSNMPYFTVDNLSILGIERYYLNIALSRMKEREEIISLKRGMYVSRDYMEEIKRRGLWNDYLEFLAGILYSPSYLSLEYVLGESNILSESFWGFSSISTKKTNDFNNELGSFKYRTIKNSLFEGFKVVKKGDFYVYKATPAKAMFDFLYLRKDIIVDRDFLREMRFNWENFRERDISELARYIKKEGSDKMKNILEYIRAEKKTNY